ncbi:hypothetical protein ACLB2K_065981 [Fragaria x ananassa]
MRRRTSALIGGAADEFMSVSVMVFHSTIPGRLSVPNEEAKWTPDHGISDFEGIEGGLKNEATDVAKDVVRIDVVGGFALQKVTEDRSYFRTIANMDIKMDLIPPSLINFVSRQLIGNGFRLYQKVVSSKLNHDEDYSKALRGPLYSRIREALSSLHESKRLVEGKKLHGDASNLSEEHLTKNKMNDLKLVNMDEKVHSELLASESTPDDAHFTGGNTRCEIEEVESEESKTEEIESKKSKNEEVQSKESRQLEDQTSNRIPERGHINGKRNVFISSEVEQAIGTIDKVILKVRQYRFSAEMQSSGFNTEVSGKEKDGGNPKSLEDEINSTEHLSARKPCLIDRSSNKHNVEEEATHSSRLLLRPRTLTHFSTPHFQSRPNLQKLRPVFPLPGISFISSQSKPAQCWNCCAAAATTQFLLCSSCRCIQPVDHSVDYFQIFGLERKYDSVEEHLEGKYKDWQKKLHPDLVHSKSEKEREYAAEQSARVIDAYRTLSKPLARAIYILKLEGVHIDEEETLTDLDLLSEMQEKLKQWSNNFAKAFESHNFEEAVKAIRCMTYYERVNEEIVKRQLKDSGLLQHISWDDADHQWVDMWSAPKYPCDWYGHCGYEPKSVDGWNQRDGTDGCVCRNGEGFVKGERSRHIKCSNVENKYGYQRV